MSDEEYKYCAQVALVLYKRIRSYTVEIEEEQVKMIMTIVNCLFLMLQLIKINETGGVVTTPVTSKICNGIDNNAFSSM